MTNELKQEYFNWLCDIVGQKKRYHKLLWNLFCTDFHYIVYMDGNRFEDGVDLRYRFGDEMGITSVQIGKDLDDFPCSVLEMMVALALRIEVHIMVNADIGDRTGKWFWDMVQNLGLDGMTDSNYDDLYFNRVMERLLFREYEADGTGGLFTVRNSRQDLRGVEIWYQAMWYLNDISE